MPKERPSSFKVNEAAFKNLKERILSTTSELYAGDFGLSNIASTLDMKPLEPPRPKLNILLIGPHSSGKSSLANYIAGSHVQKTGSAICTTGLNCITAGKRRDTITGKMSLHLFPFLKDLVKEDPVVLDHITTEVTPGTGYFNLLNIFDTAGMVDSLSFSFNMDLAIDHLAKVADLIFVLFDPIQKSTGPRAMEVIKRVASTHPARIHFFLTKIDTVHDQMDLQRVLLQTSQVLAKELPFLKDLSVEPICLPSESSNCDSRLNQLDSLVKLINSTLNQRVQGSLNSLESDIGCIKETIVKKRNADDRYRKLNRRGTLKGFMYKLPLVFLFFVSIMFSCINPRGEFVLFKFRFFNIPRILSPFSSVVKRIGDFLVESSFGRKFLAFLWSLVLILAFLLPKFMVKKAPVLDKRASEELIAIEKRLEEVSSIQEKLFEEFVRETL
ncbi:hypothetical protein P9112_004319 [Eukaryota sp. TZLM1-RC]